MSLFRCVLWIAFTAPLLPGGAVAQAAPVSPAGAVAASADTLPTTKAAPDDTLPTKRVAAKKKPAADSAKAKQLAADSAKARQLVADLAKAKQLAADLAKARQLAADSAKAKQLAADSAKAKQLASDSLGAKRAAPVATAAAAPAQPTPARAARAQAAPTQAATAQAAPAPAAQTPTPAQRVPVQAAPAQAAQAPAPAQTAPAPTGPAAKPATPTAPAAVVIAAVKLPGIPDSLSGATMVTYVSGQAVYIAAGSRDGVYHGSRVVVLKKGAVIAEVRVKFLSSHSAACSLVVGSAPVNLYDTVRFSKAPKESLTVARGAGSRKPGQSALREMGIRGRVGVSLQYIAAQTVSAGQITQPAADLRVDGVNVSGSPMSFSIDTRTRRTYSLTTTGTTYDQQMRVYQANFTWANPSSGAHVTVGRQYASALSAISLFDGAAAALDKSRWSFGAFYGTLPDIVTMSYSTEIQTYGGYVQVHQGPFNPNAPNGARWSFTMGGAGSYDFGQLNREFAFMQAFFSDRRFTLFATQEIDYNRGWKAALGEPMIQPTSSFLTAQLQVSDALSITGGFDNRRNVRLYRDSIDPSTLFDDSFREGAWAGLTLQPSRFFRIGGDARVSEGGTSGRADAYTGWLQSAATMPFQGNVRLRATKFTSLTQDGWLYAGTVGFTPIWRLNFNLTGGLRRQTDLVAGLPGLPGTSTGQTSVNWFGLDTDVGLTRSWFLLISATHTQGGIETNDQVFTSLSYRF